MTISAWLEVVVTLYTSEMAKQSIALSPVCLCVCVSVQEFKTTDQKLLLLGQNMCSVLYKRLDFGDA